MLNKIRYKNTVMVMIPTWWTIKKLDLENCSWSRNIKSNFIGAPLRLVKEPWKSWKANGEKIIQNLPARYVADEKGMILKNNSLACFCTLLLKTLRIDYSADTLMRHYNSFGSILGCVVEHWYTEGVLSLLFLISCSLLFVLLYRLLCTSTRGQDRILH